jgi:hypothetical protein
MGRRLEWERGGQLCGSGRQGRWSERRLDRAIVERILRFMSSGLQKPVGRLAMSVSLACGFPSFASHSFTIGKNEGFGIILA